tara:strand:+ start:579 stop:896 length:318 start_codon:yes stop_codon:yes gene_type:complete
MEFLSSLSLPQWAIIGIGVYMLLSGSMNFSQLLEWFTKQFSKSEDNDQAITVEEADGYDLVALVSKWDDLSQSCKRAGCIQACKELEKVFPLLAPTEKGGIPNES